MDVTTLTALSPLDGRYAGKTAELRRFLSEYALIRYRTLVEIRWLQHLADEPSIKTLKPLEAPTKDLLNQIIDEFSTDDAAAVKSLERTTNHDVKAVEYFIRRKLEGLSGIADNLTAFIHFGCTSEDINNLAYALMLRDARQRALIPRMKALCTEMRLTAHKFADIAMLSRTHGQSASPTTLGKELANFVARLERQIHGFGAVTIFGKNNGAVGNFNAHVVAFPDADWPTISRKFVEALGLEYQNYTTQIEPHDWIAEYAHALCRFDNVLLDLCRDIWGYVSLAYFRSQPIENEVGSSTMPHKVNPIEFENAEGNLGIASAVLEHLASKLPVSRMQRDLTDSTVLRNLGVGLGHSLIAVESALIGLGKLAANPAQIAADLDSSWEVLGEAIQTVMRAHGIVDAYEQLKQLTRGQPMTKALLHEFIAGVDIPNAARKELLELTPERYTGLAAGLAKNI